MGQPTSSVTYTCPASVRWIRDTNQVIVIDERQHRLFQFRGVEAEIWGLLSLRYPYPKTVSLVAALLNLSADAAERELCHVLARWHGMGLLGIRLEIGDAIDG